MTTSTAPSKLLLLLCDSLLDHDSTQFDCGQNSEIGRHYEFVQILLDNERPFTSSGRLRIWYSAADLRTIAADLSPRPHTSASTVVFMLADKKSMRAIVDEASEPGSLLTPLLSDSVWLSEALWRDRNHCATPNITSTLVSLSLSVRPSVDLSIGLACRSSILLVIATHFCTQRT